MSPTLSKSRLFNTLFFASMVFASLSWAAPGDRDRPQGPPPEAIEACADLAEGNACSFTGRRNDEITGTCMVSRKTDKGLVCAPEGGPPRERGRPE